MRSFLVLFAASFIFGNIAKVSNLFIAFLIIYGLDLSALLYPLAAVANTIQFIWEEFRDWVPEQNKPLGRLGLTDVDIWLKK